MAFYDAIILEWYEETSGGATYEDTLAESFSADDAPLAGLELPADLSESLSSDDALTAGMEVADLLGESLTLDDEQTADAERGGILAESFSADDAWPAQTDYNSVPLPESLSLDDTPAVETETALLDEVVESFALGDLFSVTGDSEVMPEGLSLDDAVLPNTEALVAIGESFSLADALDVDDPEKTLPESFAFSDALDGAVVDNLRIRAKIVRYLCTLTGGPDGVADLAVPISSFQGRLRSGDPSWLSVVTPGVALADAIAARSHGDIVVRMAKCTGDGTIYHTEEIARATLEDVRIDEGGRSQAITLSGHKTLTYTNKVVDLRDVTYRRQDGGLRTLRCATPDMYLRPGDTVSHGGTSYVAGLITYTISLDLQQMEVSEAA